MTQSPLLGFNNNVKHRGRLFHIQTEDSGVRHPHVITHLFMDGGRILKTIKTSYAEHVGSDKMAQVVRDLMKEQHKMMFIALRDGQFDHVLDSVPPPSMSGPPVHPHPSLTPASTRALQGATTLPPNTVLSTSVPAPTASVPAATASVPAARASSTSMPAVKTPGGDVPAVAPAARPSSTTIPAVKPAGSPVSPVLPVKSPSGTMPAVKSPSGTMPAPAPFAARPPSGTMPAVPKPGAPAPAPVANAARPPSPPSSAGMRAAASADPSGPSTGVRPVPRREAPDIFAAQSQEAAVVVAEQAAAAAGAPKEGKSKEQPGSGRYAASRPAAIFANARTADAGGSIFGDDLISEKSLDEVILSYLSDDLDSSSSKK